MKYKKQLATGALALSLLVSGSTIYAATPQDLGVKSVGNYQKQNKTNSKVVGLKKENGIVGTIESLTSTGFTVSVTNMKTKAVSAVDVVTNTTTTYKKDGLSATATDLLVGQKVIVAGTLDKTTNILTANTVKIVTKAPITKVKKEVKKVVNSTTKTN
jgi:hypothetical protein